MIDFGFYNMDCMEGMKQFPDKYFELAIVDPPYGDALSDGDREGGGTGTGSARGSTGTRHYTFGIRKKNSSYQNRRNLGGEIRKKIITWDVAPGEEYFKELFRISQNQIIWGGNYFQLPPTRCFLVWKKLSISESFSMAMAEYAWTSFNSNAKVFEYAPQGNKNNVRFHPTQKPVALYEWILGKYAKRGDKILDTHAGSASSLVACYNMGFDFVGFEIDETYYKMAKERLDNAMAQIRMDI